MAIKTICMCNVVAPSSILGAFHLILGYAGLEAGNPAAGSITLLNQPAEITVDQIKQAVREFMILSHGYTFGPEDTVRFIGDIS